MSLTGADRGCFGFLGAGADTPVRLLNLTSPKQSFVTHAGSGLATVAAAQQVWGHASGMEHQHGTHWRAAWTQALCAAAAAPSAGTRPNSPLARRAT
eukprot:366354-Chlamydomonas_euryale.AAC.13